MSVNRQRRRSGIIFAGAEGDSMREGDTNTEVRRNAQSAKGRSKLWLFLILGVLPFFMLSQLILREMEDGNVFTAPQIAYNILFFALPILEVIIWRLLHQLPVRGRWGFALLLVGLGIGAPVGAVIVFAITELPYLSPPEPIVVTLLVALCGAFASVVLGLLLVCVRVVQEAVQLFHNRRQARISDEI
jgi:hypothetical protein